MHNVTYERRVAAHQCIACGEPLPPGETRRTCPQCIEKYNRTRAEYSRRRRRERINAHQCTKCGEPLPEGERRHTCDACRSVFRGLYHARVASGKCTRCGADSVPGKTMCASCRVIATEDTKERYSIHRMRHECGTCGKPMPEGYWYASCRACRLAKSDTDRVLYRRKKERSNE